MVPDDINKELDKCLNCTNPKCKEACPLHTNIPKIIELIKENKIEEAYIENLKTNMLGGICGRVCPHENYCEGNCVLNRLNNQVKFGKIEAYLNDIAIKNKFSAFNLNSIVDNKKTKVAIIGGGPSGIATAYYLSRLNYDITIFEKEDYLRWNNDVWHSRVSIK